MHYQNQPMGGYSDPYMNNMEDDRFFLAPFLVGGLAGTALGYGIANNNNQGYYYPAYPAYPVYPMYPYPTSSNNYYYY